MREQQSKAETHSPATLDSNNSSSIKNRNGPKQRNTEQNGLGSGEMKPIWNDLDGWNSGFENWGDSQIRVCELGNLGFRGAAGVGDSWVEVNWWLMIMEIPLELMLTISKKLPWMFFPDIIPIGHPIFDIINSTNPESDWDLRLACLLLFAFDRGDNFWQLYGDFLPSADACTSLLLATERAVNEPKSVRPALGVWLGQNSARAGFDQSSGLDRMLSEPGPSLGDFTSARLGSEDLLELQDPDLESIMRVQQNRALEFWEKNWHSGVPLKIKRLARDPETFTWAVGVAQSRCMNMQIRVGALVQDANMLVPYADMLNHSFQPNCFFHWRFKDRMLEVMINPGQRIEKGEEVRIHNILSVHKQLSSKEVGSLTIKMEVKMQEQEQHED
ncbi:hypothetical protein Cgig2_023558 [Carnegiea gigantea]|uniref:SET domain-containing protein n=1 Tax=Carnegiea gigantea TaxID=171969 RepID=A0A9Q1Q9N5_9CARY|nr:hypothetical protein Cgig2_023558 [Carnegiea gigantea]